ncbi:T9SS type A sorting domain-containing protein [Dyadobacter crusticola]|uniref:T9SS type A sorting domain-containing protein n=1 Tax=Dyadobacter crusticola TaxID=292407 RepID=UPI0004E13DE8|nr:T9SS type A sorting domain-containing protein [Dyadobacter crusticola]
MKNLSKLFFCGLLSTLTLFNLEVSAQFTNSISTKRGTQIGLVTFGPGVETGILGIDNFVDGYVKKVGTNLFVYPVGGNGTLRPFAAEAQGTSGAYFFGDPGSDMTRDMFNEGPFNPLVTDPGTSLVSNKEFWDINGSASTTISLTWNADSDITSMLAGKDLAKLTIVGWSAGKWVKVPSIVDPVSVGGESSSLTAGSITTSEELTPDNFSIFTLGVIAEGSLPVTLASFHVKAAEQSAILNWVTSAEVNSSHFEIERSADGKQWAQIGLQAATTSANTDHHSNYQFVDQHPLTGVNLYRLKMVDLDASYTYSQIKELRFDQHATAFIYPNPASDRINFNGITQNTLKEATLVDLSGRPLTKTKNISAGLEVGNLPQGRYVVNLTFNNGTAKSLHVVVGK